MGKLGIALVVLGALVAPSVTIASGNLHNSNMDQWSDAAWSNREDTAADFAAAMMQTIKHRQFTLAEFQLLSMELQQCMDEVADDPTKHYRRANEVAVGCFLILRPNWTR